MNESIYLTMGNMGLYIGPTYEVRGDCLRTSTRMEMKGICLCKQATNVEDSPRTIVNRKKAQQLSEFQPRAPGPSSF